MPRITVEAEIGGAQVALYTYARASPTSPVDVVTLASGEQLAIKRRKVFSRTHEMVDGEDRTLLVQRRSGPTGGRIGVEIPAAGLARPELPFLVPLFYFVETSVLRMRRSIFSGFSGS